MDHVRYTEAPARREEVLARLGAEGYVASADLAAELGVSEMTIRRDLRQLEHDGLARRVAGGATLAGSGRALPFEARAVAEGDEKLAIARACLPLLAGAATVLLDAGTTVAPLAGLIADGTRVVSHSAPVITGCVARDGIELTAIGGDYSPETRSFAGGMATQALARVVADVAVLSATAVDGTGMMCISAPDADIKQAMIEVARVRILLVDHSKIGERAPIRFGRLDAVDVIVTDAGADPAQLGLLREAGVEVVTAPVDLESAS